MNNKANRQQDVQGNRVMIAIIIGFVYLFVLIDLYKRFRIGAYVGGAFLEARILFWVLAVSSVLGVAWLLRSLLTHARYEGRVVTPLNTAVTLLLCCLSMLAVWRYDIYAIRPLLLLVPAYVGLYFLYRVYRVEMFWISLFSLLHGWAFYQANQVFEGLAPAARTTALAIWSALGLAALGLAFWAKHHGGNVGKVSVISRQGSARFLLGGLVLPFVFLGGWFVVGIAAIRYGFYAMVALLIAAIIYYTVDLMSH